MQILGKKIRCKVTGHEGVATARAVYLNGCVRYAMQPPVGTDGKLPDSYWLDEHRIDVLGDGPVKPKIADDAPAFSGGDRDDPPAR